MNFALRFPAFASPLHLPTAIVPRFLRVFAPVAFAALTAGASAATISVPAGSTQTQIQTYINSAVAGDTVQFAAGSVYTLTGTLTLKNGIIIDGNTAKWYYSNATTILQGINAGALTNVTIKNLTLDNVMFRFWATAAVSGVNQITVDNCTFQNGRAQSGLTQVNSFYIQVRASNVTIKNSRFLRGSAYKGRGLQFYLAESCTVHNCLIGTSVSGSPNPTTHGWFKTAINVSNSSTGGSVVATNSAKNISITSNRIYRNTAMADTGADAGDSDHGIYAHGFDGLTMTGNTISGWAPLASGGAIKLRNAQNALIQSNTFLRSGVLLYVYTGSPFLFLKNVDVLNNTITLDTLASTPDIYNGIGFWRNYTTTAQAEYSILISGNILTRGHVYLYQNSANPVHSADWNAASGGVNSNTLNSGGSIHLQTGMSATGNSPAPIFH